MTWTYSGDPSNSDLDAVRVRIGDTDSTSQQLDDEVIDYFLDTEGSVQAAAIASTRALVAKYTRFVDKAVGDLKQSYSQRLDHYKALLAQLQQEFARKAGGPVAGGLSSARKTAVEDDSDRVAPSFSRGQFDYPGT